MKRTTSFVACLTLIVSSHLAAISSIPMINHIDSNSIAETKEPTVDSKNDVLAKEKLLTIPHLKLSIEVDDKNEILKVQMNGKPSEYLQWTLFQPSSAIISRHTTTSRINEILISTLEKGDYVLMVKDEKGRALFHKFIKE